MTKHNAMITLIMSVNKLWFLQICHNYEKAWNRTSKSTTRTTTKVFDITFKNIQGCLALKRLLWDSLNKLFHNEDLYHVKTSHLIYFANQWTGFYMIGSFVIKELIGLTQFYISRGGFRTLSDIYDETFSA